MLRYSLASLFIILLYASVGCAALVNANGMWPQLAVTMTVVVLLFSTLAAICWKERNRFFATGFSMTGWIYFLLTFTSVLGVQDYLLTQSAVDLLFTTIHGQPATDEYRVVAETIQTPSGPATTERVLRVYRAPTPVRPSPSSATGYYSTAYGASTSAALPAAVDSRAFRSIGHSLWAVILASVGGCVAQVLYIKRQRKAACGSAAPFPVET